MNPLQLPRTDSAVELVEALLAQAAEQVASDIHLIPTGTGMQVLMRCDGSLANVGMLDTALMGKVVGRLKVLADLLVYRNDVPQEGRIPADRVGIAAEVRVATYPTLLGEKVAVRLDARRGPMLSLDQLGLPDATREALTTAIQQPEGVVLITGPSGSGKTTTLYSCLNFLAAGERMRSIVSVEDPIERRLDHVVQTEVNHFVGLTYSSALRSILRQDPEVILIGEIRDTETAHIALEAGLTGHLVASTIHAGTAPQVFSRLMEMGIEPCAMTSVIRGVMAQRLLRRACPAPADDHSACETCRGTGYRGRVLVSEWISMSPELRHAVLERGDTSDLEAAAEAAGYRTLRQEAEALVAAGVTTQQEVERVLGRTIAPPDALRRGGGSGLVPQQPGRHVSGRGSATASAAPLIPRPESEPARTGRAADGGGGGAGDEPGGSLCTAATEPAAAVPGDGGGRAR